MGSGAQDHVRVQRKWHWASALPFTRRAPNSQFRSVPIRARPGGAWFLHYSACALTHLASSAASLRNGHGSAAELAKLPGGGEYHRERQ